VSKRLQVLMTDSEYDSIAQAAKRQNLAVGEYVRRELARSARLSDISPMEQKLDVISRALEYNFPAPDIEQMNAEIDRGYSLGLP
jgi:hypothetical protein